MLYCFLDIKSRIVDDEYLFADLEHIALMLF